MLHLDWRLFKSRLAWRFFAAFVICALLPIIALAAVSYWRVTRHLEDQATERLRQSAKTHALSIYERLLFADQQLQNLGTIAARTNNPAAALPGDIAERGRAVFRGAALFDRDGTRVLWGTGIEALCAKAVEQAQTASSQALLVTLPGQGAWPFIIIVHRIGAPGGRDAYVVGEIGPSFLWGLETSVLAPGIEFGVWDDRGRNLFNSLTAPISMTPGTKAGNGGMPAGERRLNVRNQPYYGFCWSAFLKPKFHVPYWTVMVMESRDQVLKPLNDFRTVFPLIVLLSLVVVAWLSSRAIRKSLNPIDALVQGAKRVAAGRFDHRVEVDSKDEFRELALAFNRMTDELDVQFRTLAARSDLDRAILSVLDIEQIVTTSLNHLGLFLSHRVGAISIIETEKDLRGRSFIREEGVEDAIRIEPFALGIEEHTGLLRHRPWVLIDAGAPHLSYLAALMRESIGLFAVFPVRAQDRLLALVSLGIDGTAEPDRQDLEQARGFADHLAVALSNTNLLQELKELNLGTLQALARTVDAKSAWTAGHSLRVAETAEAIGGMMGLSRKALDELQQAALLHDIGKIGVPSAILDKDGKLSDEEYDVVKRHSPLGARILSPVRAYAGILPAVEQHHERYDGRGYPHGAKGAAIDLMARIIAVADTFDAMVSDRPYRKGFEKQRAVTIIQEEAGKQFDPQVVEAFVGTVGRPVREQPPVNPVETVLTARSGPFSVSSAEYDADRSTPRAEG